MGKKRRVRRIVALPGLFETPIVPAPIEAEEEFAKYVNWILKGFAFANSCFKSVHLPYFPRMCRSYEEGILFT
jgi:hypothetical protein